MLARVGAPSLGAHQIAFQLFVFLALVLDAIAIAGQVMVGRMLGAGDADGARAAAVPDDRLVGAWRARSFAAVLLALDDVIPRAFTADDAVIERAHAVWPLFAAMMPATGAVFALDGILIGAGDTRFLMWGMLAASAVYVPLALLALREGWGIVGVWGGLCGADRGAAGHARRALRRPPLGAHRRPGVVPSPRHAPHRLLLVPSPLLAPRGARARAAGPVRPAAADRADRDARRPRPTTAAACSARTSAARRST